MNCIDKNFTSNCSKYHHCIAWRFSTELSGSVTCSYGLRIPHRYGDAGNRGVQGLSTMVPLTMIFIFGRDDDGDNRAVFFVGIAGKNTRVVAARKK